MAEKFAGRVLRVADSVGVKHHDVARIENKAALVVLRFFKHSQRKSRQVDPLAFAGVAQEGLLLPGVGDAQLAPPAVPSGEAQAS